MNTNRRNLVKMSAALGAIASGAGNPARIAALREFSALTDEVSAGLPESIRVNAASFAGLLEGSMAEAFADVGDAIAPEGWVAWQKAEIEMFRAYPELNAYGPWSRFAAAPFGFVMDAFEAGVRRGAVYESVRREMVTPTVVCWDCYGSGVTFETAKLDERHWEVCGTCAGEGVAVPPDDLPYKKWPKVPSR